jgi:hypothetical protein
MVIPPFKRHSFGQGLVLLPDMKMPFIITTSRRQTKEQCLTIQEINPSQTYPFPGYRWLTASSSVCLPYPVLSFRGLIIEVRRTSQFPKGHVDRFKYILYSRWAIGILLDVDDNWPRQYIANNLYLRNWIEKWMMRHEITPKLDKSVWSRGCLRIYEHVPADRIGSGKAWM